MSHPDPCYDPDNSYEDDDMAFHDEDNENYDNYNDFHEGEEVNEDVWTDDYDDSMDGDFDSAMRDAGYGTDEDYGYYGEDY